MKMTMDELMGQILAILPDAVFGEGIYGEILISTGFVEGEDGNLAELDSEDV
jgi:hypothetical protein